ncbi:MAG: carboxypeptidase regulatory-like domain-containing protein [Candidatus Polarisedimenticolia bacterium]
MRLGHFHRHLFCFLAVATASGVPAVGQSTTAVIRGRVTDEQGVGLPGVVVVIRSADQPSGNTQAITDLDGRYRSRPLPVAGDYLLKVESTGFAQVEVGPVDLDMGKSVVQDITLRTASETTEIVVVEARGGTVDTESTRTSSSYGAEFIEGLPLIGHNYQDVLLLAPGVTDTDGDGNPNVHGARDTGLQYRLDGGNITDPLYGGFGQNLNMDIIEEIEIITSGASAEYGRADGGFANIITKSGGNDFEGKFSLYWQGRFLNGDGANSNDINSHVYAFPDYQDVRPSVSLGGAIVKDRLWYFASVELLDTERPVNQLGAPILVTSRGHYAFAKITWQADLNNKVAFQVTADPRTFEGLGLRLGVSPESDYRLSQGGPTPQLKWTATLSPRLLLESTLTSFHTNRQVESVSSSFEPIELQYKELPGGNVQLMYPCKVVNCDPSAGETHIFRIHVLTGQVTGPYYLDLDQEIERNALKADLSLTVDDAWGLHSIKGGFELQDETFHDMPLANPILYDYTKPFVPASRLQGLDDTTEAQIQGFQTLQVFDPQVTAQRAEGFNTGFYLLDAWKPRPNLTLTASLRIDREDIDSSGYVEFNPLAERSSGVALWRGICAAADALDRVTDDFVMVTQQNCYQYNDHAEMFNGLPATFGDRLPLDHPASPVADPAVRALDLDGDGDVESTGDEGSAVLAGFTSFGERQTSNFSIVNTNLAPRFAVSWDPWADGRTKLFGTWGRYFDRLFLNTVTQEIGPDVVNYAFYPSNHVIIHQDHSTVASTTSITQTARGLKTPYTDELTLGVERELAPEWSGSVTWIRREGSNLLQDVDLNHLTCPQLGQIGIDPRAVCGGPYGLEVDRFGEVGGVLGIITAQEGGNSVGGSPGFSAANGGGRKVSNGAPDLYTMSPVFNQVLRVDNANSYEYDAIELKIVKRLHRNWQMQASYTWSRAFGQAEAYLSRLGDDPETADDEEGFLSYDQRHVGKFQAVARLPHEISLGSIVQWSSGTPYSFTASHSEFDSMGNLVVRTFYPSGQRNDHRNEGAWRIDARIEKGFVMSKVHAAAFLNVENVLNDDTLIVLGSSVTPGGVGLNAYREFGRRFELGATFKF